MRKKAKFQVGETVYPVYSDSSVMITDVLYEHDEAVYECNDGFLYYEHDLREWKNG